MESDLIAWLRRRLPGRADLIVPPGDDAAVLRWGAGPDCVVTVDVLMDGVDFELDQSRFAKPPLTLPSPARGEGFPVGSKTDPRRAGRKALAVNLSDLAAMAARPRAAVIGLVLPREGGEYLAHELYEGLLPLAARYNVVIAGGDVNSWDSPLVISVTLLGEATSRGVLRRGGARPGDAIVVTGSFGGSILGHHLDFEPRVDEALLLNERYEIHAAIDVSDGLSLDLSHLAVESGCGAVLELPAIPLAPAAHELAAKDGVSALEHALADGEDFELILAVAPDEARRLVADQPLGVPVTRIGHFCAEAGLWQVDAAGRRTPLVARGFEHRLES